MTAKEYKLICRIKVTRIAKFITWLCLVTFFVFAQYMQLNPYVSAIVGTTIWLYMPDLTAYIVESMHKLKHDFVSYR